MKLAATMMLKNPFAMKTFSMLLFFITLLAGCSATKSVIDESHEIHTLVASKSFEFTADWTNPMVTQSLNAVANAGLIAPGSTISRINITGTGNFLKVSKDSVSADLPYYGERQFGGGYGAPTGIEFDGIPDNYQQRFNAEKQLYTVSFQISDASDRYQVSMEIYPTKSSTVNISMTNRFSIRYEGNISSIELEDNQ